MADLTGLVETGLISVLFSSIGTGILLFLSLKSLKQRLFDYLYEFLGTLGANKDNPEIKAVMEPISALFSDFALGFIAKFTEEVKNDPVKFVEVVKPALGALFKEIEKDLPKGAQEAIASGGIQAIAPLLPKKFQKYAFLLQFVQGIGGNTQQSAGNPSTAQSPFK